MISKRIKENLCGLFIILGLIHLFAFAICLLVFFGTKNEFYQTYSIYSMILTIVFFIASAIFDDEE